MFQPYYAQIEINREEPDVLFNLDVEIEKVLKKFKELADTIVTQSLLRAAPDKKKTRALNKKLKEDFITEERKKHAEGFLILWNKWRDFYFGLPPLKIKRKSDLSAIESAIEFAKEKEMNLSILIACVHRAYLKRTFRPHFNALVCYGEEIYDKFYDKVEADLKEKEYIRRAEA